MSMSPKSTDTPRSVKSARTPKFTEDSARWLSAELRQERQAMQAMLLARHEALLRRLVQDEFEPKPEALINEVPKSLGPVHASRKAGCSVSGTAGTSTEQVQAIELVSGPDSAGEAPPGAPALAQDPSEDVIPSPTLTKANSSRSQMSKSSTKKTTRSLIYGDRHPDKGLFHIDRSSMRNFVKGPFFETSFAILILINTIFMALEYQFNGLLVGLEINYPYMDSVTSKHWPWARDTFEASEWFFGLAFSCELVMKLAGLKCDFFKDCWNYLDLLIVMFWIIDVLPLDPMLIRVFRLAKLLRLIKLAKSIKSFDSLYLLTASIASSASALLWSGALICIVQLSVALILSTFLLPYCTDLSNPPEDRMEVYRYFGTFSRSMLSMFELTLGNWVPISRILSEKVSEWYTIFTLAFQVVLGFAVIKVITGVFLTETMKVATMDDSIMLKSKERAVRLHKEKMGRLFEHADLDSNGCIDCVEFHQLLQDKEVRQWLSSMELDIWTEQDGDALFTMIDDGDGLVTLDELVKGVARLKGQARNVDLALMNKRLLELKQDLLDMQQRQFERLFVYAEDVGQVDTEKRSI